MATTLPAGILTTHHPPLVTTSSTSTTVSSTTPMPLYMEDSSTVDDYSYFTQTDDYKYFGIDKEATTTEAARTETGSIDYWVDLGEEPVESLEKPNQSHSQRHVEPPKEDIEETEEEILFAEPARFETRESSTTTTARTTTVSEASQITRAPVPLNSGNFITFYSLLLFFCFL